MKARPLAGESARRPRSLWEDVAVRAPQVPPLAGEAEADIAIVGAGYTGLAAALRLAAHRVRVVVLDAAEPGWGASGRNIGQVIPGLRQDPVSVERALGRERGARLVQWAGDAPDRVFELIDEQRIPCQAMANGWIEAAYTRSAVARIEARCAQWAARGAPVSLLPANRLEGTLGTPAYVGAWTDARGGTIDPLSYVRGLTQAALLHGARIHGGTPALELTREFRGWAVRTPQGLVRAERVFVATAAYSDDLVPGLRRSMVPMRIALVASAPLTDRQLSTILPFRQAVTDTRRIAGSFRISPCGRLMLAGTWATASLEEDALLTRLHGVAHELFGHLGAMHWEYGWSGYYASTGDRLPHLHESPDGVVSALGCNGRGIALSTCMGLLVAERLLGGGEQDLALSPTPMPRVAFHQFRGARVALSTRLKALRDRWDRATTSRGG